jgi:hypothetical protein
MTTFRRILSCFCAAALMSPVALAQCGTYLLAALDENNPVQTMQTFDASVWTHNPVCPISGQIIIRSEPPGLAEFDGNPYWVESFFDVFTECHTVKPTILPLAPPGSFFDIFTEVTFTEPSACPPMTYVENVTVDMMNRLRIVRPLPCMDNVPGSMEPEQSYCFQVCHRVYTIPLYVPGDAGKPIINVTPGCAMPPCGPNPCTPGDPTSYRSEVYQIGGQWYLEFEYSNPALEPVCFCVTYEGNLPLNGETHVLGGWDNERQTMDVSVWTNNSGHPVSGTIEIVSCPNGAQFGGGGGGGGSAVQSFFDIGEPVFTFKPPVGAGSFVPGEQFHLTARIQFEPPGPTYPPQWVIEDVVVTPEGGLQLVNPTCTGPVVIPQSITPGTPECLIVCHDIYYIPIRYSGPRTPTVNILSGCGMTTPCNNPLPCTPGAMTDFRYDVFRVGGTWMLEFEYSNPHVQPVCYCVGVSAPPTPDPNGYLLGGLAPDGQHMNISVWGSSPAVPLRGDIMLHSDPPGAQFDFPAVSFFDVFTDAFTWQPPVRSGIFTPGQVFQLVANVGYFDPGSDPFEGEVCVENVIVTPSGTLALWDPYTPCTGDNVPSSMIPGQSACFRVCHRIYETILYYNEGGGRPFVHVIPGCNGLPQDHCVAEACTPGGPDDYMATVYHNGVDWVLRFEYSNPYTEPVCYCVTYAGNVPWDCDTRELAALDEGHMHFDVSVRTISAGGRDCPANGTISIYSYPSGADIPNPLWTFADVDTAWHTVSPIVGPGSFGPGETFQLIAHVDYTNLEYPDRWLTENVVVTENGLYLNINDVGGECYGSGSGDDVPGFMNLGDIYCFRVCHRVYHVALGAYDPLDQPHMKITPGCLGSPQDLCLPQPECTAGGSDDYRWTVWWAGDHWELEFEYSNENVEPVCYCIIVGSPPCNPVTDLVTYYEEFPSAEPYMLHFWWTAPQRGFYQFWYTTDPLVTNDPPGEGWQLDDTSFYEAGSQHWSRPLPATEEELYRRYAVICDCGPWPTKK